MELLFCLCGSELGYDNIMGIFNSKEEADKALNYELSLGNDCYIISGYFYKEINQYLKYTR